MSGRMSQARELFSFRPWGASLNRSSRSRRRLFAVGEVWFNYSRRNARQELGSLDDIQQRMCTYMQLFQPLISSIRTFAGPSMSVGTSASHHRTTSSASPCRSSTRASIKSRGITHHPVLTRSLTTSPEHSSKRASSFASQDASWM